MKEDKKMKRDIFKNIAVLPIFILLLIWVQAAVLASSDRLQTFEQGNLLELGLAI